MKSSQNDGKDEDDEEDHQQQEPQQQENSSGDNSMMMMTTTTTTSLVEQVSTAAAAASTVTTDSVVHQEKQTEQKDKGVENDDDDNNKITEMDWVLTNYDEKHSQPQSLEAELQRLQTLRSYLVLDTEREIQFERLTGLASRILDVPIALVSLVDLGRQWFMSNRGLGDVRETPRNMAFCSHAILSKDDLLIIKDAQKDPRFQNNPLVTGPPHIRFYAGAPLETPEGYNIGTFCVIDTKPWPDGMDLDSKQNLREFAALTVQVLVSRRIRYERYQEQNPQQIACTAHDLLTPLSGIELSLHLLKDDKDFQQKLVQNKKEDVLSNMTKCSDVLQDICKHVRSTFSTNKSSFEHSLATMSFDTFSMDNLVDRLYVVMASLKKYVPIKITIDKLVPKSIVCDPSRIFRCAMNYLVIATQRTKEGMISLSFQLRQSDDAKGRDETENSASGARKGSMLYVKCEDTAPAIDVDEYQYLFMPPHLKTNLIGSKMNDTSSSSSSNEVNDPSDDIKSIQPELCLFSVASEMNVIGGEYGFRTRDENDKGCAEYDAKVGNVSGSLFWFSLPCGEIGEKTVDPTNPIDVPVKAVGSISPKEASQFHQSVSCTVVEKEVVTSTSDVQVVDRPKRALVIEDSTVVRKMLTRILIKLGFEVSGAENGMVGLDRMKSTLFDLVLCDFLMPVMDGLDCVKQYREWENCHRPWFSQRIIGISAHASDADVDKGLKAGMNDYKPKPVTAKVLSDLVKCADQMKTSTQLDEIEMPNSASGEAESDTSSHVTKRSKSSPAINGRVCTCLIIAGALENEQISLMHDVIKNAGWETTTATNDVEAFNWLKMRNWDLILVDEEFSELVGVYRAWEVKKGRRKQQHMVLMSEHHDKQVPNNITPPTDFDLAMTKPICQHALKGLLEKTHLDLSQKNTKRLI